jgi:phosphatidylinositol alpha-1,6-mannosyltransferase
MSNQQIVLLTSKYPPPFFGGSRRMLFEIFSRFSEHELTIFTKHVDDSVCEKLQDGPRLIRRSYIFDPLKAAGFLQRKFRAVRLVVFLTLDTLWYCSRRHPSCIVVGEYHLVGLTALVLKRLLGLPFVLFIYGEEVTKLKQHGGWHWKELQILIQSADRIITISHFTEHLLKELRVDASRISVVFPSVDINRFHPDINAVDFRSKMGASDERILLTVSRLAERKGQAEVIRALPQVMEHVPKVRYIMIGPDPFGLSESLLKLAKTLKVEQLVTYLGVIDENDLPQAYAACDVFIMAAHEVAADLDTEGFGMVFVEANACGKPVIGGRAGGTVDAIEDGKSGLLVDAANIDELSRAIITLLTDQAYAQQLGEYGQERVMAKFTWDRVFAQVRDVIHQTTRRLGRQVISQPD